MDHIIQFIFNQTVKCINIFKRCFLYRPNYKILNAELEYIHEPLITYEDDLDPLWLPEVKYWSDDIATNTMVNITNYAQEKTVGDIIIPLSIDPTLITLWYLYNDKCWKFFTRDINYKWPPEATTGGGSVMKFTFPIKTAHLMNNSMENIYDVTGKIKKYAGPFNNFFNQEITPDDILGFEFDFKFLKIVNIVGTVYIVSVDDIIKVPW